MPSGRRTRVEVKSIPIWCAVLAIAIGAVALAGWMLDVPGLKSPVADSATMKVNAAVAFLLAGASLWLLAPSQTSGVRRLAGRVLAWVVVSVGLATLSQEWTGVDLRIDQLLLPDSDEKQILTSRPGRMAVSAATSFVLLGAALALLDWRPAWRFRVSDVLVFGVAVLSSITAAEYAFGGMVGSRFLDETRMAVHAIPAFLLLCVGVIAARPRQGALGLVRSRLQGSLERSLYAALGLSLLALFVTGGAGFFAAQESIVRANWVNHTQEVRRQLSLLVAEQYELESAADRYLLTGNRTFLQGFDAAREASERTMTALTALVRDNPVQSARVAEVRRLQQEHFQSVRQTLESLGQGVHAALSGEEPAERGPAGALRSTVAHMDTEEARLLDERFEQERDSILRLKITLAVSTLLAACVVVFSVVVIHRDLEVRRLREQDAREQNEVLERRVQERTARIEEDEVRLRTIVESLDQGVVVFSLGGSVLDFNPAAMALHGYTHPEEYRRQLPEFPDILELSSDDGRVLPLDQWPISRILRGEVLRDVELTLRHLPEPEERVFSYSGRIARDSKGKPLIAVITMRDITDRKRADARIRAQLERLSLLDRITRSTGERLDLRSIFQVVVGSLEDSMPAAIACVCLHDAGADTLTVTAIGHNGAALPIEPSLAEESAFGVDRNGLSRCMQGQLVYEPDVSAIEFPFPQRLARGGIRSVVMAPLRAESQVFGALVVGRTGRDAFTSIECEFIRQLSEHVALSAQQAQLYESLQRAYDDLRQTQAAAMQEERLRALGQMASGIAHDINNALSPVSLYTESLLASEKNLSDRARGYLETIQRAVEDVAQTVSRMREFYRRREQQVELVPVALNRMVRQVIDLTKARWSDMVQANGIVVDVCTDLTADLPAVMGVESDIREALTNLVFNGVDALPEGGTLTLRSRVGTDSFGQNRVMLEVTDTGVGMDETTRKRCLEPFFTTKGERGTGLGLAMVYGMVQRHSADIQIDSAPGAGTTVRILFDMASDGTALSAGPREAESPRGLRLLVIDDDPILIKSLRDALEVDGHIVETANGGEPGIAKFLASLAGSERFAAVITDLGMPKVDGRRVAAAIKHESPATPVIMLTGWGQRMAAEGDVPPHVDRVLAKPPKLRELREALSDLAVKAAGESA